MAERDKQMNIQLEIMKKKLTGKTKLDLKIKRKIMNYFKY